MEGAVLVWQEPYNHPNSMEQLHHPRPVWCCVLLGEGDKVATGCEGGMLRIWSQDEFGGWDLEREFRAHDKRISAVAVSTNPERLASGSHDMTVRVWTRLLLLDAVPAESCLTLSGHKAFVTSVDFSSDGSVLASGSFDMSAIVWDLATGTVRLADCLSAVGFLINCVFLISVFSPSACRLAQSDRCAHGRPRIICSTIITQCSVSAWIPGRPPSS
eukprot:TRINITY_DN8469_c0_g1_i2.p1 TRINITY_DN8469_c0_g1~~TRINITY_DN8469_c0_g1_i2.p1  ORF type:complete len:216 (+),score=24.43 TRINITY_DN8469_c0_g1_i2:577-1224(+)